MPDSNILGGAVYSADGESIADFGNRPALTFEDIAPMSPDEREKTSLLNRRTYEYDVVWDTEEALSPYTIVIRHDARHVRSEYIAFIGRIAGLVVIISVVVTASTLLVLDGLLIAPLLRLRRDLLAAGEIFSRSDDERIKPNFASLSRSRDDELGDIFTAFSTMVDRTAKGIDDLQAAQLQLVHSEKMSSLGHLVAGIAHEINNPINFIYGNVGYVNDSVRDLLDAIAYYQAADRPADGEAESSGTENTADSADASEPESMPESPDLEELEFILEDLPNVCDSMRIGAERVRDIVLSLRNFARLDEADLKTVDVHDGLDNALLLLRYRLEASADRPAIEVRRDYHELPAIECYAGQLNQALLALLLNAIEATESLGFESDRTYEIAIATRALDADRIVISIADAGDGIAPEVQPKIFDPFFTTKPVGQNKGLGLSIADRIVAIQHGGTIEVESELQKGTTVTLTLPVRHAAASSLSKTRLDTALDRA
ncbi:MAG: sensor histidine kinase [Geitlerinemataceae cyanobacterium]